MKIAPNRRSIPSFAARSWCWSVDAFQSGTQREIRPPALLKAKPGFEASQGLLRIQVLPLKARAGGFLVVFQTETHRQTNTKNEQRMRELICDLERFSYSITHNLCGGLRDT